MSLWPRVFTLLNFFHLTKYENKVKKFGTDLVIKKQLRIYKVKFLQVQIPEMEQNGKYIIPVKLQNNGKVVWKNHEETMNAINLSYVWKNKNGNIIQKNEERTSLPKSTKPRKKIKFRNSGKL